MTMEMIDYALVLEQAKVDLLQQQGKLGECLREQESLEARILGLRQTVVALSKMLGQQFDEEEALGLTDAIRDAFRASIGRSVTALEVRGILEDLGYDISKYGNFMASIHSVLKRLAAKGEIREAGRREDGKVVYAVPAPMV
jgi:hypothetical protein